MSTRSSGLLLRVFLSILAASLAGLAVGGVVARWLWARAFDAFMASLPMPMGGRGGGRSMILGTAQDTFLSSVNYGTAIAAIASIAVAAVVAWLLARYVARPLYELRRAAGALAAGDLAHRVEVRGPSEVEDLAEAFNDMAGSLQEAEALRRRLVADVAHELRNPVAALRAQAEGISEGVLVADGARLASLLEDVEHLSRLIDDLQELSAADAGGLRYEFVTLDLADSARREVERARAHAAPGVELCTSADAPALVRADDVRISQVLRNLLSNAVRHTGAGMIEVRVRHEGAEVVVEVVDTGEGIPERDLPFIFERFYRADTARARATGGHGIGLAVTRRIVEDHGGRVFATSTVGEGARIGFALPAEGTDAP